MTDQEYNDMASKLSKARSIKTAIHDFVGKRDGVLAVSYIKLVFMDNLDRSYCTTHIYQKGPDGGLNPDYLTIMQKVVNNYNKRIDDLQARFDAI